MTQRSITKRRRPPKNALTDCQSCGEEVYLRETRKIDDERVCFDCINDAAEENEDRCRYGIGEEW